jgi:cobalt-precorrin 5A hydrolase
MASGDAGDAMGLDQAMIVAGIGCKAGTSAREIEAAIGAALSRAGLENSVLGLIATSQAKASEPGITAAAADRGLKLAIVAQAELESAGARTATRSERVLAVTGVPSLSEAAALAAAGPGARLLAPRVAVGPATCALAISGDAP